MNGWLVILLSLIAGILGLWFVWGKSPHSGSMKEAPAIRLKASALLGVALVAIYLVGSLD